MSRVTAALLALLLASGCVSVPAEQRVAHDPWEPLNRGVYSFNDGLDRITLRPLAKGYNWLLPGVVREGVTNFGTNLLVPRSSLNSFLQGKPRDGFSEIFRFLINSTVGIGGIFDFATFNGLEAKREDFGQTLAVWGVPQGPYVVLPLLGPQTLSDAVVLPADIYADTLTVLDDRSLRRWLDFLRLINLRSRLLQFDDTLAKSPDPYVTTRESWLQNREFSIYDGNPPTDQEEEDLFDEFFEEEEY